METTKSKISISIAGKINSIMEKDMINKSKLINHLIENFFKSNSPENQKIIEKFTKKK